MCEFVVWLLALRLIRNGSIGNLFFVFITCLLMFSCISSSNY